MSKQHFELIARVLRESGAQAIETGRVRTTDEGCRELAAAFAAELAATNPRFNRERFIAACMGEDSHDSAGRRVRYSR